MSLTVENYLKGFLVDEQLMGGISEVPGEVPKFAAFVLRHTTGEYLGYEVYDTLQHALASVNSVQREWKFESSSGCGACGDGNCAKAQGGGCRKIGAKPDDGADCSTGVCPTS